MVQGADGANSNLFDLRQSCGNFSSLYNGVNSLNSYLGLIYFNTQYSIESKLIAKLFDPFRSRSEASKAENESMSFIVMDCFYSTFVS